MRVNARDLQDSLGGASKNLDHEKEQRSLESVLTKVTGFGKRSACIAACVFLLEIRSIMS
jgi:hypothetical protein